MLRTPFCAIFLSHSRAIIGTNARRIHNLNLWLLRERGACFRRYTLGPLRSRTRRECFSLDTLHASHLALFAELSFKERGE